MRNVVCNEVGIHYSTVFVQYGLSPSTSLEYVHS
jgi:hypothetical protein